MAMTRSGFLNLPPGWESEETANGADLRVISRGRRYISVAAAVLALLAATRTLAHWGHGAANSAAPWLALTFILGAFALWCALADEVWQLQNNCLVHQVGIGRWKRSTRCQNAELEIGVNFSTKFGIPYYRLYAVENGSSHFLMERSRQDLQKLAEFISHHTGWKIR